MQTNRTRVLHVDPMRIPLGEVYALPNGVTIWHYPELGPDATAEQIAYRRQCLARLDLAGHRVIETMQQLAEALAEEQPL